MLHECWIYLVKCTKFLWTNLDGRSKMFDAFAIKWFCIHLCEKWRKATKKNTELAHRIRTHKHTPFSMIFHKQSVIRFDRMDSFLLQLIANTIYVVENWYWCDMASNLSTLPYRFPFNYFSFLFAVVACTVHTHKFYKWIFLCSFVLLALNSFGCLLVALVTQNSVFNYTTIFAFIWFWFSTATKKKSTFHSLFQW